MELTKLNVLLKESFNLQKPFTSLGHEVACHTYSFLSEFSFYPPHKIKLENPLAMTIINESGKKENSHFRYSVFTPANQTKFKKSIILLHGLNERLWDKYLLWAYHLVRTTGRPVILFPLAFHINRSPRAWNCPRTMSTLASYRKQHHPHLQKSSFANAALSLRMEYDPEMFCISGIQSYFDLVKLVLAIKEGHHPLFEADSSTNLFAYSIGALLAEVLLLADPLCLFSSEKAFLFCGGTTFDKTNGVSKAIMDNVAFEQLTQFMTTNKEVHSKITIPLYQAPLLPDAWNYFQSMINPSRFSNLRESRFSSLANRLMAVGLTNDQVIPAQAIAQTLINQSRGSNPEVYQLDFPFPYSHEKPFPIENNKYNTEIEESFNHIFSLAADYLR